MITLVCIDTSEPKDRHEQNVWQAGEVGPVSGTQCHERALQDKDASRMLKRQIDDFADSERRRAAFGYDCTMKVSVDTPGHILYKDKSTSDPCYSPNQDHVIETNITIKVKRLVGTFGSWT